MEIDVVTGTQGIEGFKGEGAGRIGRESPSVGLILRDETKERGRRENSGRNRRDVIHEGVTVAWRSTRGR
jgi:hypothetical protein